MSLDSNADSCGIITTQAASSETMRKVMKGQQIAPDRCNPRNITPGEEFKKIKPGTVAWRIANRGVNRFSPPEE